jgi:hypothetical protein
VINLSDQTNFSVSIYKTTHLKEYINRDHNVSAEEFFRKSYPGESLQKSTPQASILLQDSIFLHSFANSIFQGIYSIQIQHFTDDFSS